MSVDQLITLGRQLAELGYCPGGTGNLSWRDGDEILITRSGVDLMDLSADDFVTCQIDWDEREAVGSVAGASKELPLHIAMHARYPQGQGFVGHVHSAYGATVSCLPAYDEGTAIPPLTPYFVMKVGKVPLIEYAAPGSQDQADQMFDLETSAHTMLLQNHGFVTWASDIKDVLDRIRESELTAEMWLQLRGFDDVNLLTTSEQQELLKAYPQ